MVDHEAAHLLGTLFVMLGAAKTFGFLASRIGQPSVLGELLAGLVIGKSALGVVDPADPVIHAFGELGVILLLFTIGLETDLRKLLHAGASSTAVAVAGVVVPFALGYAACRLLGLGELASIVVGASLTATSVGITARVLADLGRLKDPESQIVLGAAVIDDVIGLVILTVVAGLAGGKAVTPGGVAATTAVAFGFLAASVVVGRVAITPLTRQALRIELPGTPTILAVLLALGLAWLAVQAGSAMIIGAFAAGLLLVGSPRFHEIEVGVTRLGYFFVPLFFVSVGAGVDVRVVNPLDRGNWSTLLMAGLLSVLAVAGKFCAGYAPVWFRGRKRVIGVAMIPRGEVGLIFAQMGSATGILDPGLFAAVTLVMMVTTFLAPPLLKHLLGPPPAGSVRARDGGVEELTTKA